MLNKKKDCEGWDGNSHLSFIYKRINGKKYCKSCAFKIEGKTSIKKTTDKQKEKSKIKTENSLQLRNFFEFLWRKLPPKRECTICAKAITGDNKAIYWHHILAKAKYPDLALEEDNIVFLCETCHSDWEISPTNEFLLNKVKELKIKYDK